MGVAPGAGIPGGSYGASMTVVLQLGDAHAPEYMAMHEPLAPSLPCKGRVAASAASSRVGSATRSAPHPAACGGHLPPLGEGWSKRRVTSTTTSAVIPLARLRRERQGGERGAAGMTVAG